MNASSALQCEEIIRVWPVISYRNVQSNDMYFYFHRCSCTGANFLRVREQFNRISSYIDGTNVYGDADRLKHLRSFSKGKMILDTINGETFIPVCNTEEFATAHQTIEVTVCNLVRTNASQYDVLQKMFISRRQSAEIETRSVVSSTRLIGPVQESNIIQD